MTLTAARTARKIGYVATIAGRGEAARQRERLSAFGCDFVFESDATHGLAALRDALAILQAGDQLVLCSIADLALPRFVLEEFVAGHGATVLALEP